MKSKTYVCDHCKSILENFENGICPVCPFVRRYQDQKGTEYFVKERPLEGFAIFCKRMGAERHYEYKINMPQKTFAEAQTTLNMLAQQKKWHFLKPKNED